MKANTQANTVRYIPAMGHRALTPLYDPFLRLFMREQTLRRRLIDRLSLRADDQVLDVGSGTGTFAILAKQSCPQAQIVGVDADGEIVERARRKARAADADVRFQVALATELPFEAGSFDRVTSTFVMHHLSAVDKAAACREALRVLRPGGELHVVDFGPPRSRIGLAAIRILRGMGELADNIAGRIPGMLTEGGFAGVSEEDRLATLFGPAVFLCGRRPG